MIDKMITCCVYVLWLLKGFFIIASICFMIYIIYVLIAYILYIISHKRINLHSIVNNLVNKFLDNLLQFKKSL